MGVRPEVIPFLIASGVAGLLVFVVAWLRKANRRKALWTGCAVAAVAAAYMLWFFRDPERVPPGDPAAVVAAADGRVAAMTVLSPEQFSRVAANSGLTEVKSGRFAGRNVLRISIFLSLFSVHVNRMPMSGTSEFLGYFPGKRFFTFQEKSSDRNQHNSILLENGRTVCLVNQIVGPVCRRVVYWLDPNRKTNVKIGDRFGMMKFGSRLDMYLPADDVAVVAVLGTAVRAGETVVAIARGGGES